ncbi:MAG: phosphoribosylaminoimidazolesuccinocarboxamide synthase [Lentisphaeria bacterium]
MKYDANGALLETSIDGLPEPIRGKVRDIYVFDDSLMLVASDRLSAFDVVMPNGIPDKGRVLTYLSKFWCEKFDWIENHLISMDVADYPAVTHPYAQDLEGRSMLVRKLDAMPVEAVARGYLIGSGWKDYQRTGSVCGISLPPGQSLAGKLDDPLYTPAYKAPKGEHDENITYAQTIDLVGAEAAATLRDLTLRLYSEAAAFAHTKGIIIADTKFEFGLAGEEIVLIDEVLTPDSSRFWPIEEYEVGTSPPSFDKQFVRDWLETQEWGKTPPAPNLPDAVVEKTREKYLAAYEALTGLPLPASSVLLETQ